MIRKIHLRLNGCVSLSKDFSPRIIIFLMIFLMCKEINNQGNINALLMIATDLYFTFTF